MAGIQKKRRGITVLTGDEFNVPVYLKAGYSGVLAGGGVLTGFLLVKMVEAARCGDFAQVAELQQHCERILYPAYGGRKIKSWLTGLKYTLVKMNVFKTTAGYLQYPLPASAVQRIDKMVEKEHEVLFPRRSRKK